MLFLAIGALLLIQSIFACMNVFYFAKDIEYILPLPVKPIEIIMAKFNTILVTEYITEAIFSVVPLAIYGILTGAGIAYYIFALIGLLLFPILPILVSLFLVMIVMSFAKFTKNKDKFQMITSIILIIFVLIMQFSLTGSEEEMSNEEMAAMLVEANGMVEMIGSYFITLKPTVKAIAENSVIDLAKVLAITGIAYVFVMFVGQKLYLRGAIGNRVGNGKKYKKIDNEKAYNPQNIGVSYVKKEIKILFRNPIFFMQCVLPSLIMPIIILIGVIAGFNESGQVPKEAIAGIHEAIITLAIVRNIAILIYNNICSGNSYFERWAKCGVCKIYTNTAIQTIQV